MQPSPREHGRLAIAAATIAVVVVALAGLAALAAFVFRG